MPRQWIKLWVNESLRGTLRFDMEPDERGTWYDLLALAGDCKGDGTVGAGSSKPYPLQWIANTLNIPLALLERTLDKCVKANRIKLTPDGILILNWGKYQSEYDRQKKYRK